MAFEPGHVVDRYRIESLIGQGGMGSVYRAYDTHLHRTVALKILEATKSPELSARVLREARAAAALNHPNAISIFDAAETLGEDGEPIHHIAMELIEGRDLRSLAVEPSIGQTTRLRWLADVARALAAAHRAGLVHRDMKPENVMVRVDGVVKVLDFGLARRSTRADSQTVTAPLPQVPTLTARGVVVGTPLYMSPEQLRADPIDARADQFSWGVLAYELLAGAVPWVNRQEPVHLIAEILSVTPAPLIERAPDVPPSIAEAIMRTLEKSAAERFATMDAIVEIFDSYLQVGGTSASVASLLPPSRSGPLAFAPTIQSTRTSMAAADARQRLSARPGPKRSPWARIGGAAGAVVVATVAVALVVRGRASRAPAADASAPVATSIADLPLPPDTRPEVASEYREAMRRLRASDLNSPGTHLRKAIALDPDFAPALLFMGIHVVGHDPSEGRDLFRRAEEHADRLTERDRAWLEAFKPFVQRQPADLQETRARMEKVVARFPLDAGLRTELADVQTYMGDLVGASATLDRALAIDPGFAYALAMKAQDMGALGDLAGATRATEDCAKLAPIAPQCVATRADIARQLGECADLEKRMRDAIAIDPSMPDWYFLLAEARFLEGKSPASVREAADQGLARSHATMLFGTSVGLYGIAAEVLAGDFRKADDDLRAHEALPEVSSSADEPVHALPDAMRVAIALETGRPADAAAIAEQFLSRREVWSADPTRDREAMGKEFDPEMLHALRSGGKLDDAEYTRRLGVWIDRWTSDAPMLSGYVWLKGYATVGDTADAASRALDAMPRFLPLPGLAPEWAADARVGRTYLRASQPAKALPYLRRGAAACTALSMPFEHVHALGDLGEALEAAGDRDGACAAYAGVLVRWGSASPRSITAERARARVKALACPSGDAGR